MHAGSKIMVLNAQNNCNLQVWNLHVYNLQLVSDIWQTIVIFSLFLLIMYFNQIQFTRTSYRHEIEATNLKMMCPVISWTEVEIRVLWTESLWTCSSIHNLLDYSSISALYCIMYATTCFYILNVFLFSLERRDVIAGITLSAIKM